MLLPFRVRGSFQKKSAAKTIARLISNLNVFSYYPQPFAEMVEGTAFFATRRAVVCGKPPQLMSKEQENESSLGREKAKPLDFFLAIFTP